MLEFKHLSGAYRRKRVHGDIPDKTCREHYECQARVDSREEPICNTYCHGKEAGSGSRCSFEVSRGGL